MCFLLKFIFQERRKTLKKVLVHWQKSTHNCWLQNALHEWVTWNHTAEAALTVTQTLAFAAAVPVRFAGPRTRPPPLRSHKSFWTWLCRDTHMHTCPFRLFAPHSWAFVGPNHKLWDPSRDFLSKFVFVFCLKESIFSVGGWANVSQPVLLMSTLFGWQALLLFGIQLSILFFFLLKSTYLFTIITAV